MLIDNVDPESSMVDKAALRELNKLTLRCPYECGVGEKGDKKLTLRTLDVSVFWAVDEANMLSSLQMAFLFYLLPILTVKQQFNIF